VGGDWRGVPAVKNRFGVARCCCESFCEDCCNGNAPTEWDVDLALTDGDCDTCDEYLGGVFTLARTGPVICDWSFQRNEPLWTQDCETDYLRYGYIATNQAMNLEVRCVNESQYQLLFNLRLQARYTTGTEYDDTGAGRQTRFFYSDFLAVYRKLVDFEDFICDEQVDYEIPLERAFMSANFWWLYQFTVGSITFNTWVNSLQSRIFTSAPIGQQTFVVTYPAAGVTWNWVTKPICDIPATIKITAIP
jgi:hypothetical protein